jgi:hypothetical protein
MTRNTLKVKLNGFIELGSYVIITNTSENYEDVGKALVYLGSVDEKVFIF